MKIKVKLHPNSSQEKVLEIGENSFECWIKERAVDGKANLKLVKLLKKYFEKEVRIKSGFTSRNKIVEIID